MARKQLKIVRLLEPEMCYDCRFAHMAEVEDENSHFQTMVYCKRLDCDNWDHSSAEPVKSIRVQNDEE